MKKSKSTPADAAELRRLAEERLKEKSRRSEVGGQKTTEEMQRLVHELQVHQIELALQNEELQRARTELEAGLERYTDLYDFAPTGYVTLDRDGAIRKVNLTGARLLGLERSRLVGGRFGLFVSPECRSAFNAFLKKVFESPAKEVCEVALCPEKGGSLWVQIEAAASEDVRRECRAALVDITERRRAERIQRHRDQRAQALVDLYQLLPAPEPEIVALALDRLVSLTESELGFIGFIDGPEATMSAHLWSRQAMRDCAIDNKPVLFDLRSGGLWAATVRQHQAIIVNDYAAPNPLKRGCPAGHVPLTRFLGVPLVRDGRAVLLVGLGNRVEEYGELDRIEVSAFLEGVWGILCRKRAEEALRQSERRFRDLFESMAEGFALGEMIDNEAGRPVDWRYLEVNAAFAKLTGLPAERVVGRTVREVIPGIESHWIEAFGRVVKSGLAQRIENRVEGLGRHYEAHAWRAGVGRFAVVFSDVTERKRAEEALLESEGRSREAAEALREADRNKNQFLAMLSHELRNPLAPITNSLYILEHAVPGGDQALRAQAVIGRQVGQLSRLVDDLLDVTRISRNKIPLQRQRLELNELVRRTIDDHRPQFEKNEVRIELRPAPELVFVDGDWNRLAQVVGNLLQNAAKFTGRGGRASVSVSTDTVAKRAVVRVRDTGVGMAQEMLARLFQPFAQADTTLDRSQGGLGLGLALVKGLVELHGGDITAHSAGLSQGAEFVVRLPLMLQEAAAGRVAHPRAPGSRRRVLIIEDNTDAADCLREALEYSEHEVEVAYNGPEGIARAREYKPEVVLCDIGLPGMDGYEVARAFRGDDALKGAYLVALSGYALPEDLQRASEAGFDRHLAKPPSLEKIEELLGNLPS